MDLPQLSSDEKKSKPSFWNRLLRLPRKSHIKEKHEDSFKRQSMLYSSLTTPKRETQGSSTSDESDNFTTLESSALMDIHRDAGILFLNKSSMASCFVPKEENKHVQFAPTPMNKYYKVDIKSAPAKKQHDENKENLQQTMNLKPCRSILRLDKSRKASLHSSSGEENESNPATRLVNVTYIDGPEFKTPSIPRTSTKIALVDRKNGSLPQLNVSNVVKYSSLPRNQKMIEEKVPENRQLLPPTSGMKNIESFGTQSHQNMSREPDVELQYRRSLRGLNAHRQSCYGVSDPSRIFEGKKILQAQNHSSSQGVIHRLSLGRPLNPSRISNDSSHSKISSQKSHSTQDDQKNCKRFFNVPLPPKRTSYARSLDQPVRHTASNRGCLAENYTNRLNWQLHHASTGQIPNKAINEVGLPIVSNKRTAVSDKTRSVSPHYIPLSETFTANKANRKISGNVKPSNSTSVTQRLNLGEFPEKITSKKQKAVHNKMLHVGNTEQQNEQPAVISETRKQAIMSAMYTQKRKIVNKICKYNSKQSDEGFSSMADDECSFNCSCPSCVTKLSKSYKRGGLKQLFSHNKDKYFFTIEPEIKEGNEMERLPENQTFEGPMAKAQPRLSSKNENEPEHNKTWYDCNDTLCKTPNRSTSPEKARDEVSSQECFTTTTNKLVDNIYENLTQIINSATKKDLKPQDVKRILSTPTSSPLRLATTKCQTMSKRALFTEESNTCKTLDQSLKQLLTPVKTSDCFNDSVVLLQEIFQKLSQECKELLQPDVSSDTLIHKNLSPICQDSPGSKYINDLVKNLKSAELSEADFANIIGGIAQNIFSETKAKNRKERTLSHSTSLPDLQKKVSLLNKAISVANSLRDLCDLKINGTSVIQSTPRQRSSQNVYSTRTDSTLYEDSVPGMRQLPDGWSRTPTTENSNQSNDVSSPKLSSSGTDKDDSSKCSEEELQLLENAIRVGMGLAPVDKLKKTSMYAASPTKASKYKSRDVLSGKGKLKLKIYYNSGLVTVYVMKAAKLDWTNGRELNAYVKITMIPDEAKRVHWRTNVQKAQKNPVFNQKLSFELLAEDVTKRLIFSVWHRDYAKQRSELVGCMSFSVRHVMDNTHNVDGWYRLLRERFGTQKHFAAHARNNSCSFKK